MRSILLLFIAIPLSIFSQTRPDELPLYDAAHAQDLVEIKAHTGLGISSLIQNYGSAIPGLSDIQLSPGVLIRAGMDVRFAIRNSLAIGTGLAFDINNSKYAMSIIDSNTGSINSIYVNNHFYQVTTPLYISWRLNLGSRISWNIDLGSYVAFAAGGKMKGSGYTSGENSLGQPVIMHTNYETKYFRESQAIVNGVKDFDYGPRLATGFTYGKRYSLNIIAQVSAPNLALNYNVLDIKYRNITLEFEFGYNF